MRPPVLPPGGLLFQLSLWFILISVDGAIAGIAFGPDQQQKILAVLALVHRAGKLACRLGRLAVDFKDHVAGLDAGIVGGAGGANALNDYAVQLIRRVDLLAGVRGEIADGEAEFAGLGAVGIVGAVVAGDFSVAVELAYSQVQCRRFSVAQYAQGDLGSWESSRSPQPGACSR